MRDSSSVRGAAIAAAFALGALGLLGARWFPDLRHALAIGHLHRCAQIKSDSSENERLAFHYLDICAQESLPALVGYSEEPILLSWLLDARTGDPTQLPTLRRALAGIGSDARGETESWAIWGPIVSALAVLLGLLNSAREKRADLRVPARRRAATPSVRAKRALVVDDDPEFSQGILRVLSRNGFRVDLASSSAQARKLLTAHRYDCIFCDFQLGSVRGTDLCDDLLDDESKKNCIIVSGHDSKQIFNEAIPAYGYLRKPCSSREILSLAAGHSAEQMAH